MAAALVVAVFALALLAPFGWAYSAPEYGVQAGVPVRFGPRPEDLALLDDLSRPSSMAPAYRFQATADASVPPGLAVDATTGALTGTPSTPGTYTLAVAVESGGTVLAGRSFRLVVSPEAR